MKLMSTAAVAQRLHMTPDNVRYHERQGHLLAIRVECGDNSSMRLYLEEAVAQFEQQRAMRKLARTSRKHHG
jgi:DNA-binding transcriptional MerR regulator